MHSCTVVSFLKVCQVLRRSKVGLGACTVDLFARRGQGRLGPYSYKCEAFLRIRGFEVCLGGWTWFTRGHHRPHSQCGVQPWTSRTECMPQRKRTGPYFRKIGDCSPRNGTRNSKRGGPIQGLSLQVNEQVLVPCLRNMASK